MITPPVELQSSEVVLLARRRHPVFLWPKVALFFLVGLVPLAVVFGIALPGGLGTVGTIVGALALLWAVYWLVRAYFAWYRYQNDMWIVTNQRILDSRKRHWFNHNLASADLVDVEDMSIDKNGMLATMLGFGDVRCQTAGVEPNFVLSGIADPAEALTVIDAARDASRRELRGIA